MITTTVDVDTEVVEILDSDDEVIEGESGGARVEMPEE